MGKSEVKVALFTCGILEQSFKMSIIRLFVQLDFRSPAGYDRTRGVEIGNKNFKLTHLEEAYTSEHWLVRIYKVKDLVNREKVEKPTIPGQKWKKKSSKKVYFSEIHLRINFVWNGHEFSINYNASQKKKSECYHRTRHIPGMFLVVLQNTSKMIWK